MVGVRDVARAAGVSTATVVRVVKGQSNVAPETRAAVEAVIAQLGYVPNAAARALTSGRSRMIGLLVPSMQTPFNAEVAESLQHELLRNGYSLAVSSTAGTSDALAHLSKAARDGTLAGVAMTSVRPDPALLQAIERGLACVFIDQRPGIAGTDVIRTNNRAATFDAVSRLIRLGHRRIGLVGGPLSFDTARERLSGYRDAHSAHELELDPSLELADNSDEVTGYKAAMTLLGRPDRPTALFSFNGRVAVGILEAVRKLGVQIPADVSVVSFDDEPVFTVTDPPLTAIKQPTAEMGTLAAQRLVSQLENGAHETEETVLPSMLIERESTAPPGR